MRGLLLLIILTPLLNFSQENKNPIYTISGKIIDAASKNPLEYATVVFKSLDSDQIKFGCITNERGNFSVDIEKGTYNATVEFISYKTKKLNISTINRNFNIGSIQLELDIEALDIVEITAEKRALEFKPNMLVFNVDKDISSAGSMASEVLNNIPAVSVDPNGNISLRGQNNVTVMINGKTSSMAKYEALKSLPANSIEKIEVITNPGAKYKASAVNIINIILKKGKDEGLNASITATGGFKDYYGGLINLNNKTKKVNLYTNTSYFHRNPISTANFENEYFNNGLTTSFLNEKSEHNSKGNGFYSTVGADFYLSKKSTLSTIIKYQNIDNNNNSLTVSDIFDESRLLINSNDRDFIEKFNDEIIEFEIDFEHNFNKEGQKLTSYILYTRDVETYNISLTNSATNFTDENYRIKNTLKNKIFDITFTSPVNEKSLYYIGYNGDFGKIPFTYSDAFNDNDINYSENVHSVFVNFEHEDDKFSYELGLRAEFAETDIEYLQINTTQSKHFNDLAPSMYVGYNLNDTQNLSFSYTRRILRPGYTELQPFEQKISETASYIGNEKLDPIYFDKLNLAYVIYGNKLTFSPSLFFDRYNGYWEEVTYETGQQLSGVNKLITTPANVGKVDYYGTDITAILKASKILNFTGNILLVNFDQSGTFETINSTNETIVKDYNKATLIGSLSLLTQLKIPNVFDFQMNLMHYLNVKGQYTNRKAYTYANAAISKDLFDKEATLSLTVDDIFKSNKIRRDRFDNNYFSRTIIENKFRTIKLSFTYRFNQSKKDRKIDFDKKDIKPNY